MMPYFPTPLRNPWLALTGVVVAGVFAYLFLIFPYASGYGAMRMRVIEAMRQLWGDADWTHGMLVPPIVLALLIYKRKDLFISPPRGSMWGLPVLAVGFFVYWIGYKANVYYFGFAAGQILLGGAILWFLGLQYFWRLFFIWCFFAFTWPMNAVAQELQIAYHLRVVMVQISSGFLNLVGMDNVVVGTSIQSAAVDGAVQGANYKLDVADPCSGIRSIFALLMVTALWGYLTLKRPWQRWVLFLSAPLLAIIGNFFRIMLLVFGSRLFGTEFAIGAEGGTSKFHFIAGILVFVVALTAMVVLSHFLKSGIKVFKPGHTVRQVRVGEAPAE
jgi:exosortase